MCNGELYFRNNYETETEENKVKYSTSIMGTTATSPKSISLHHAVVLFHDLMAVVL